MPVVVNCRFLSRPVTGVERYATEIIGALAQLRSDLVLVAPPDPMSRPSELGGVPVQRIGWGSGHSWEQTSLVHQLRRMGDPLLLSLANSGPIGYRNQVVVVHDVLHRRHPEAHSRAFRAWYGVMTPLLVRNARALATVSAFSRDEIDDVYGRKASVVIPNAPSAWIAGRQSRPIELETPAAPFFLMVGSRAPHKDPQTAYRAFAAYRRAGGGARLLVVGSSPRSLTEGVRHEVDRLAAEQLIVDLGRVSDDELAWLYANAQAFLFPSRYEGFGIPPLEAQAAGTPVIAADIPVLREVLHDDSVLRIPPGDADALARAMARIEDPRVAALLVAAGHRNAERYSWSASATALSKLIQSLESA